MACWANRLANPVFVCPECWRIGIRVQTKTETHNELIVLLRCQERHAGTLSRSYELPRDPVSKEWILRKRLCIYCHTRHQEELRRRLGHVDNTQIDRANYYDIEKPQDLRALKQKRVL